MSSNTTTRWALTSFMTARLGGEAARQRSTASHAAASTGGEGFSLVLLLWVDQRRKGFLNHGIAVQMRVLEIASQSRKTTRNSTRKFSGVTEEVLMAAKAIFSLGFLPCRVSGSKPGSSARCRGARKTPPIQCGEVPAVPTAAAGLGHHGEIIRRFSTRKEYLLHFYF